MSKAFIFKNFNNYYNRKVIMYSEIHDYINTIEQDPEHKDYAVRGDGAYTSLETGARMNFAIKDGIYSSLTYNYDPTQEWQPDYVIITDNEDNIKSRWFVLEAHTTRRGQYVLNLRRDVIADNYSGIINSDMFIEKATLPASNPLFYNQENFTTNQIKQSETLLKDKSNCAWIVGFLAENQPVETEWPNTWADRFSASNYSKADLTYTKYSDFEYSDYTCEYGTTPVKYYKAADKSGISITIKARVIGPDSLYHGSASFNFYYDTTSGWFDVLQEYNANDNTIYSLTVNLTTRDLNYYSNKILQVLENNSSMILADEKIYSDNLGIETHTETQINRFKSYNNKNLHFTISEGLYTAGYYTIETSSPQPGKLYGQSDDGGFDMTPVPNTQAYYSDLKTKLLQITDLNATTSYNTANYLFASATTTIYFNFISTMSGSLDWIEFPATANTLTDAPYRMFAIPYGDNIKYKTSAGGELKSVNKIMSMNLAQAVSTKLSGTWLYDLQLLPYCPLTDTAFLQENCLDLSTYTNNIDYKVSNLGTTFVIFPLKSQFYNIDLDYNCPLSNEPKVQNQTELYRLCSPSYNAMYDFNAARNGGVIGFNADYCYKPYNSYIHINPNFGFLYGQDFNDARGLICTGDFSLPQTTSAWETYTRNNVNYQNAFDRQIQNMDFNHKYDMIQQGINAGMGTIQGGISGGAAGSFGGPAGAAIGAVVGTVASAAGGIADLQIAQNKYNETIDYTKDQFGFNLDNIKAQAQTLSKISAYTPNNKIYPVLERYDCTEQEKEAFRNKIKYNGMTVGVIDKMTNYILPTESYIKGKIIRLENISDDYHMTTEIASELNRGVFI